MKLSDDTISVLKNFAAINKNILIHKGNTIRTISPPKTIMAKAVVGNEFPTDVCLYELNRFLNTLALFDDPDVDFRDTHALITSGSSKIRYSYAEPDLLIVAKQKDLNLSDIVTRFTISHEVLTAVDRARKTLSLEEVCIESKNGKLWIKAVDASEATNDEYALEIGESGVEFKAVMKADNLELMPMTYEVEISSKGITYWKGDNVEYWIVLVANKSEF